MFSQTRANIKGQQVQYAAGLTLHSVLALMLFLQAGCSDVSKSGSQSDIERLQRSISDIRTFQAEQTGEIASIRTELRELFGRLEELEYLQSANLGTDISNIKSELDTLQKRVPPPPMVPDLTLELDEILATKIPNAQAGKLFSQALDKLRKGAYRQALPLLQQAYDVNQGAKGSVEMLFWKGVCYDGIGDNRRAMAAYGELITSSPKHERKALALLRQGSVFIRMGDSRTAELTFQKLIAEYPRSSEAARARERLKDLK